MFCFVVHVVGGGGVFVFLDIPFTPTGVSTFLKTDLTCPNCCGLEPL